ncbi:hypothetical protein GSI_14890 [Ganoderma sinense ZZ0214-1]|uniref:Uncharacterized protein n=1 Tax=Ganoderma sinense ZZ0214-1 TaxID=1077348 RepID=A0A2G8RPZ7_9APHY|nr:hypothetical protein GSI_14890 [Ganoderma sinense ZZ0214-1]
MSDSLEDIRRIRRILASIAEFKRLNISGTGQRAVTCTLSVYDRFLTKQERCAERYRAARAAMLQLDPEGDWTMTYQLLRKTDLRGPRRDDDENVPSEGHYKISWIWLTPQSAREPGEQAGGATAGEFTETMCAEWARAKARVERWEEEETLLLEEMRRVLAYFEWKAQWWRRQAPRRGGIKAQTFEALARRSAAYWVNYLKALGHGQLPAWLLPYVAFAKKIRPRKFSDDGEDLGEEFSDEEELN